MPHILPDGNLELICGSMFSGKTEELLRRIRRAQIARKRLQVFKPVIDHRYGIRRVASHTGIAWDHVYAVTDSSALLAAVLLETEVVAIDEVQFFDDNIVNVCDALADAGKRVIAAGLDQDFRGEPFGPMPMLMALAESVEKLQAICVVCGAPASRTQRLIDGHPARYDDPVILVGGSESYEARCRACHDVPGRPLRVSDLQLAIEFPG